MEPPSLSSLITTKISIAFDRLLGLNFPVLWSKWSQFPSGEWPRYLFCKPAFSPGQSLHLCPGARDGHTAPLPSEWPLCFTSGILGGYGCLWSSWHGTSAPWVRRAVGAQYAWSVPAGELPPVFNGRPMPVSVPTVLLVKKITCFHLFREWTFSVLLPRNVLHLPLFILMYWT